MSSKAFYRVSAAIIAFSAAHSSAYAFQTAPSEEAMPASEPDATDESGGVDEIIVTANRRAQNQQEVPISIVAFEGETLKVLGVQSTVDLPQITPGLSITRTLVGASAFLRGVVPTLRVTARKCPSRRTLTGFTCPTRPLRHSRSTISSGLKSSRVRKAPFMAVTLPAA